MNCELCRFIVEFSDKVWRRIGKIRADWSTSGNRIQYSEETITETLLLELKERFEDAVYVTSFSKQDEEPRYGADWFWSIKLPSGKYFNCLVQAKKIDAAGLDFGNFLSKKTKKSGRVQIDSLISTAHSIDINPIYVFYLNPACKSLRTRKWKGFFISGCSIASAVTMKKINSKYLSDIMKYTKPLAALFCKFRYKNFYYDNLEKMLKYIFVPLLKYKIEGQEEIAPYFKPSESIPKDFMGLLPDGDVLVNKDDFIFDLAERYPDIGGFALMDLNKLSHG